MQRISTSRLHSTRSLRWLKWLLYKWTKAELSAPLTIKAPIDYSIDPLARHTWPQTFIWMQRRAGDVYLPPEDALECLWAERQKEPEENKRAAEKRSWVFHFFYQAGEQRPGVLEDTLINRLRSGPRGPWQCEEGSIRASQWRCGMNGSRRRSGQRRRAPYSQKHFTKCERLQWCGHRMG